MPTYTYECPKCQHTLDLFHAMTKSPRVKCPACGHAQMKRLLGSGAGIIFKGSGFYETDYKNNRNKGSAAEDRAAKSESATKDGGPTKTNDSGKSEPSGKKKSGGGKAA